MKTADKERSKLKLTGYLIALTGKSYVDSITIRNQEYNEPDSKNIIEDITGISKVAQEQIKTILIREVQDGLRWLETADMTAEEIRKAVDQGEKVFCGSEIYEVIKDKNNEYLIRCIKNDYCIGLTNRDNITLNGEDFYIKETAQKPD